MSEKATKTPKKIGLAAAIITLAILSLIFCGGFTFLKFNTQAIFLVAAIAVGVVALLHGYSLKDVEEFFLDGCRGAVLPAMILMVVGAVIGSWIVSGIVPTIIYYGLGFLTPSTFLVAGFAMCCLISFFTGSSYTAISTIGIALLGIGMGLDVNPAITAGMIISGSLFGDKMSPFSDSTNMAAAAAGTDVFDHVYSMLYTTVPAVIISAILYFVLGLKHAGNAMDMTAIDNIRNTIAANFNITPIVLIIPILTIFMTIKKVPPIMALVISAVAGIVFAFIFQPQFTFKTIMDSLGSGFTINTEFADVNKLLSRGGMMNMMGAVCLTFLVLGMGQILQRIGVMDAVLGKLAAAVNTPRALVITTLGACLLTTMVCASQYVAIVLPGQVMQPAYTRLGVKKRVLSRTLEDGGTIFCFLLPWTTSGVYVPGVLGVPVLSYAPYAFFCLACPILCVVYALTGFAIFKEEQPAVTE
ncbi:MAG: Na+/H+ antiporter NhaC [Clostridia bacterium]|nr:Na+/H+ antiporter NhaC [Clostridia bacterium]